MLLQEAPKPVQITPIEELSWPSESADFSPLVHTIPTTVREPPFWLQKAGLSRWNPLVLAAANLAYSVLDEGKKNPSADRLRWCQTGHWFVRHEDTGEVRLWANSCNLRWCPKCAAALARFRAHNVGAWCDSFDNPKFLTLTIKHSDTPLADQRKYLCDCFRKLRLNKEFRRYVYGGVWGLHIKRAKNDGLWHPHIHALIHADFYPHNQLLATWSKIAPGSTIVDIRSVHDSTGAAYDIAGYTATPSDLSKLSPQDGVTVIDALHGKRICGAWGTAKGVPLHPGKLLDREKWHNVGSLAVVLAFYLEDPNARSIADAWHDNIYLEEGVNMCRLDAFIDDAPGSDWNESWSANGDTKSRSPPREEPSLW